MTPGAGAVSLGAHGSRQRCDAWLLSCGGLTLAYAGVVFGVVDHLGRSLAWPIGEMATETTSLALLLVASLLVGKVDVRRSGESVGLREAVFLVMEFLFVMTALAVVLALRANLRDLVPVLNGRLHDSSLWQLDTWLHGGLEPAADAATLAADLGMLPALDAAAGVIGLLGVAGPVAFWALPALRPVRSRALLALLLLCAVVVVFQVLWPALGPVFYRPSRFTELAAAPRAEHLQWVAMGDYLRVRGGGGGTTAALRAGVASLPSFEIGSLVVFALAATRRSRLCLVFWCAAAVSFGASLALGWHYAVDGYAAAVLAGACWVGAGRLCGRTTVGARGLSAGRTSCDGGV